MNTCATCKWWGRNADGDELGGPINSRHREAIAEHWASTDAKWPDYPDELNHEENYPDDYLICHLISRDRDDKARAKNAFTEDAEQYYAALCTAAGFGCNEWEAE